jgi:pseudaminic acid biosynthesis-associated methylase
MIPVAMLSSFLKICCFLVESDKLPIMNDFKTEQELFWSQDFGNDYIERNQSAELYAANLEFFSKIFARLKMPPGKILELGANIGMNIAPIKSLFPEVSISGVEINPKACEILKSTGCDVIEGSILDLNLDEKFDLVFTKGVLIHINPDELTKVYKTLYSNSTKYILVAEYYNPTPVSIEYRGHSDRLFKRDFAGELLSMFKDLNLVDYGFAYHLGTFPQDDITWFLLEKSSA